MSTYVEHHCPKLDERGYEIYSGYNYWSKKYDPWEMKIDLGHNYADTFIYVGFCPYCGAPLVPVSSDIYRAEIETSPGHFKMLASVGARDKSEAYQKLSGYPEDHQYKNDPDWQEWIKQKCPIFNEARAE